MKNANLDRLWTYIDNSDLDVNLKEILIMIHAELESVSCGIKEE